MAQTRGQLICDHLEFRTTGTKYSDILDLGENPQEFWAAAGEWFVQIDESFDSGGYSGAMYIQIKTSDDPNMAGSVITWRYLSTPEAELVAGYTWPTQEGWGIPEDFPTMRYLNAKIVQQCSVPFVTGALSMGFLIGHKDMKSKLTFDVNGPEDEGKLEYLLDNTVYDTWVYDQNRVTSVARPSNVVIHYPQAVIGNSDRDKWMEFIRQYYAPAVWPRGCYDVEFEKNENSVTLTYKLDGEDIETDVWEVGSNCIVYGARPAIDWTWADYYMYSRYHKDFINAIETFAKQS